MVLCNFVAHINLCDSGYRTVPFQQKKSLMLSTSTLSQLRKKIHAEHISSKELVPGIYEELIELNGKKARQINKKVCRDMSIFFTKEKL
jgi:hypothetical protein